MPQQLGENPVINFAGGLVTEQNELQFPVNASLDELNCDLLRDGSRRRRLGIELETSAQFTSGLSTSSNSIFQCLVWSNVGEQASVEFLVVQSGSSVIFYKQSSGSLSANRVDTTFTSGVEYELDLSSYERPNSTVGAANAYISVASIKGGLVVASPEINTLLITRDITTGAFTVSEISFRVRDYEWQGDISTYDTGLATGSVGDTRIYDTQNVGWIGIKGAAALTTYTSSESEYPALNLPWYSGKDSSDNFSVSEWQKIDGLTTLLTNGHYILDLYSKDRQTASGLSGVTNTTEDARFSTVAAFAGRVFYSGMENSTGGNSDKIYFTQVLEHGFSQIGDCLQVNDPTAEFSSDLLASDGGFITIPDAFNIKVLHVFGPTLYIFAENGVWTVNGVENVFKATEYSVNRLSEEGIAAPKSFVSANGRPYWWSDSGIHTLSLNEGGIISVQDISRDTIQTFWKDIGGSTRDLVQGAYDAEDKRVVWAYPNDTGESENRLHKLLIFDELASAFIPWAITDGLYSLVGVASKSGFGQSIVTYRVVDSSGNPVTDSSGNPVTVQREGRSLTSSKLAYLVRRESDGQLTFANFTNSDFKDWQTEDYSSYLETGYTFLESYLLNKNAKYIVSFFKSTEEGWESSGSGYTPIRCSSCLLSTYWNFKKAASSTPQEAYRLKYLPVVDENDLSSFDYPDEIISSKMKTRGRGKALRVKWESSSGKDFHILGWSILYGRNV